MRKPRYVNHEGNGKVTIAEKVSFESDFKDRKKTYNFNPEYVIAMPEPAG
jgi:hypothetical protein